MLIEWIWELTEIVCDTLISLSNTKQILSNQVRTESSISYSSFRKKGHNTYWKWNWRIVQNSHCNKYLRIRSNHDLLTLLFCLVSYEIQPSQIFLMMHILYTGWSLWYLLLVQNEKMITQINREVILQHDNLCQKSDIYSCRSSPQWE